VAEVDSVGADSVEADSAAEADSAEAEAAEADSAAEDSAEAAERKCVRSNGHRRMCRHIVRWIRRREADTSPVDCS